MRLNSIPVNPADASPIRPRLRSYQSSPSIRLFTKSSSSTRDKTDASSTTQKPSRNSKKVSFDPSSLMADAAKTGDLVLFQKMLAQLLEVSGPCGHSEKEIVNYQSVSRRLSPLHLAASYNHLDLCRYLVHKGANVNLMDVEGWTPMHCAAAEGHLAVFELLVKEPNADLEAMTFDGEMLEDVVEDEDVQHNIYAQFHSLLPTIPLAMTETLQAIYVRDYETRTNPKPHSVFRVEVHAAVRTWSVWKRYSEFEQLHQRLTELFPDHPPPQPLPAKHWWQSTMDNPELLEE
ncbi:hypothetical protein BGW38_007661, partial [Lunasporangiospora selenospora]